MFNVCNDNGFVSLATDKKYNIPFYLYNFYDEGTEKKT